MSFTCSLVHFNHKRFVICIKDPATYVSLGTDKKNRTLIQKVTDHKVCIKVTLSSLFSSQFISNFGGVVS